MLKKRIRKLARRERMKRSRWVRPSIAAAAVALLVLGMGFYQRAMSVPAALVARTMEVYRVEVTNPLDFRSGDVRKVAAWLEDKFQKEVRPLVFTGGKGNLLGVRLCPFAGQKGAFVRYRSNGHTLALFIGPSESISYSLPMIPSFRLWGQNIHVTEKDGFQLAFWKKGMWFYALVLEDKVGGKADIQNVLESGGYTF